MTKKDFERAATITQFVMDPQMRECVITSFAALFMSNPRFDEARFRAACVPGARVNARPKRKTYQYGAPGPGRDALDMD